MPASQRRVAGRGYCPSPFVRDAVECLDLSIALDVLDLPAGTGRHSLWLAAAGHRVTAADIDPVLLVATVDMIAAAGHPCVGRVVDATQPLPFVPGSFDLVVITDFVDAGLLSRIGALLRLGGHLIYESYAALGQNWRQLLPPGRTLALLAPELEIVEIRTRNVGPILAEAEVVKLIATPKLIR